MHSKVIALVLIAAAGCGSSTSDAADEARVHADGGEADVASDDARRALDPATFCVEPEWSAPYCDAGGCHMPDGSTWQSLERGGAHHWILASDGTLVTLCLTGD